MLYVALALYLKYLKKKLRKLEEVLMRTRVFLERRKSSDHIHYRINNVDGTVAKCVHSRVLYELVTSIFRQGLTGEVKMQMLNAS
jgi:hypothetical protein